MAKNKETNVVETKEEVKEEVKVSPAVAELKKELEALETQLMKAQQQANSWKDAVTKIGGAYEYVSLKLKQVKEAEANAAPEEPEEL